MRGRVARPESRRLNGVSDCCGTGVDAAVQIAPG